MWSLIILCVIALMSQVHRGRNDAMLGGKHCRAFYCEELCEKLLDGLLVKPCADICGEVLIFYSEWISRNSAADLLTAAVYVSCPVNIRCAYATINNLVISRMPERLVT